MLYIHHHSPYHEVQGVVLMLILDGPPRAVQITSLCRRLVVLKVGWHCVLLLGQLLGGLWFVFVWLCLKGKR